MYYICSVLIYYMIMTKLLKQILTICACALMFVSCKEPELTPNVEVSAFQHTFSAEGGNFSLTLPILKCTGVVQKITSLPIQTWDYSVVDGIISGRSLALYP